MSNFIRRIGGLLVDSLVQSKGGAHSDPWSQLWLTAVAIKNSHNDLPHGTISSEFVYQLTTEVNFLAGDKNGLRECGLFSK